MSTTPLAPHGFTPRAGEATVIDRCAAAPCNAAVVPASPDEASVFRLASQLLDQDNRGE